MADKIIKLKLDTSSGDASIKASEALLVKLKARIAELEAELAKVDPKPIEAVGEAIKNAVAAANEPIKLDVNTDKEKIDALIASLGSAKKEAAVLAALAPVVNVSTNADQVAEELKSIDLTGAEVPVNIDVVGLDAVKSDIASVASDIPSAEVPVVPVDIDSAKAEITSIASDVPTAEVPVQPIGIDAAKQEIASIGDSVPAAEVDVQAIGVDQVRDELNSVVSDVPSAEVPIVVVGKDQAQQDILSVGDVPPVVVPVVTDGVDTIESELGKIDPKPVVVPVVAEGVDQAESSIASIDPVHDVKVKVTTNIPDVQPALDDFKKDVKDLSFEQKIELAIDASKAAASLAELKKSQKELQSLLLQSDEGSENFNRLAAAAGDSKNRINDVNEAIKKLSNSPIENLSGGFKSVKQSLLDLNFTQFNKDVNALGVASKKVSFKELASSVGETGKSFLSLGKIILANPIGLLVTIVTLVITNFDKLKDTLSGLAPVFEFIGDVVDGVIQTLKDLGDAIGLTSFAADEASAAALDAANNNFDELKKAGDRAVALAKARGEDVTAAEYANLKDQKANRERALAEYADIVRRKGSLTDDEKKQQQELVESNKELAQSLALLEIAREKDTAAFAKAAAESKLNAKELGELRVKEAKESVEKEAEVLKQGIRDRVKAEQDALKLANPLVLTAPLAKQKELQDQLAAIEAKGAKEIERIDSDSEAQKTRIASDAEKKRLDEFKSNMSQRQKLIKEESDYQSLLKSKQELPLNDITSLRLALSINRELQNIEEARIQRRKDANKITASDALKETQIVVERYEKENRALQDGLELRKKLEGITIDIKLDRKSFNNELTDILNRIDDLNHEQIDIEAQIKIFGSEDVLTRYDEVKQSLMDSQREYLFLSLKQSKEFLLGETNAIIATQKEYRDILARNTDPKGKELTPEARKSAEEYLNLVTKELENNKKLIESLNVIEEVQLRSSKTAISASDQAIISEVGRIKQLKEEGKAVSDLEQAFLDANRNAQIDIKINADTADLNRLKQNLNDIAAQLQSINANPLSTTFDKVSAQLLFEQATKAFLEGQAKLNEEIKRRNQENGSPMANALGVTDSELLQLEGQAAQAAVDTAKLIGDAVLEQDRRNIQREFDLKSQAIDDQSQSEIEKLQLKLDRGQITQETFDQRKAESDKKAADARLAAEKVAFQKEKQIKLKQLNIEFALEVGRIWASYAVLPPGASVIASLLAVGTALAGYTARKVAIEQETFEYGGAVGQGPRSVMTQNEPFHGVVQGRRHTEGGEHFTIRGTNRVAELEKDEIVIRRPLAIRDRNKLLAYNAGHIKLFEDGGMIADALGTAASSFVSAAGSNIKLPPSIQSGVSPIGFAPEQNSPQVTLHVTDLERVQNGLNRTKKRVTFRS